ncbi:hypothetical protein RE628_09300 [Paenibacillus sp. D2_2]|nr:hypothetical protein [Paenibacillus sp. D2_2]WMT42511.1 hypothetical protein RE628_09300 [Paenibacillus sp. D2_2]
MGYSPDVTLGIWIGYKEPANTLSDAGKSRARSIWALVMNEVTENEKELFVTPQFTKPDGIVSKTVSGYSGKLPTDLTREAGKLVTDIFNVKYVPTEPDDVLVRMKYITYDGVNYIPQEATPSDMVRDKVVVKRAKPIKDLIEELQHAFSVMKGGHKSLDYYMPNDAGEDAPNKIDPRVDDGAAPAAPINVRLKSENGSASITFNKNNESDVVGYRLYRSTDGVTYQNTGKVALAGEATQITDSGESALAYYVTAVDVAGKESVPSAIVSNAWIPEQTNPDEELPWPLDPEDPSNGQALPAAPGQVSIHGENGQYTVSWAANATDDHVTSYSIYISDSSDGSYSNIGSTPRTQYSFQSEAEGGWIKVTAYSSKGESIPSSPVKFGN